MSRETREYQTLHEGHHMQKVERSISGLDYFYYQCPVCGMVEWPLPEYHKLMEYSKDNQFMFVQDWILALLYSNPAPIIGITSFIKQLFLVFMEFAVEENIPTENPGFKAYKFGPYSERIEDAIIGLEDANVIITDTRRRGSSSEYFYLTEEVGIKVALKSYKKLTSEQQRKLRRKRKGWHQSGPDGLINYIYRKYPEYAEESLILERVLRNRRLGQLPKD